MAVVWQAEDQVLGRHVAVKLLAPKLADRLSRERIRSEAQVAAKLAHPNVAGVYDFGESRNGARKRLPYIVMELVDGETLATRLRGDRMHWRTAVRICAEIAAALAAAHSCGVVHCDVKPGNVMLARTGVKVVDFGIAAAAGDVIDDEDELLGTPAYIAPERICGVPALPASDVYALGVVMYQCLTGDIPWDADSASRLLHAHRAQPPAPLPPVDGLPVDVVELYEQCLNKDPDERPSSMYAALVLAEAAGIGVTLPPVNFDLDTRASNGPTLDLEPRPRPGLGAQTAPHVKRRLTNSAALRRAGKRHRVAAIASVGGVVAAVAVGTAAHLLLPGRDAAPHPEAAIGQTARCAARYAAQYGSGGAFTAEVVLTNTGADALDRWSLAFALPRGQTITNASGALWWQQGQSVTLRGKAPLVAGATVRLGLAGTSTASVSTPTSFTVDGAACAAEPAAGGSMPAAPGPVSDAPADLSGDGSVGGPARAVPRRERPPSARAMPAPAAPEPPALVSEPPPPQSPPMLRILGVSIPLPQLFSA